MREPGYYWVKQNARSLWEVARFEVIKKLSGTVSYWFITGWEDIVPEEELNSIDERKVKNPNIV
jgi:hypothetical protein